MLGISVIPLLRSLRVACLILIIFAAKDTLAQERRETTPDVKKESVELVVLGIAQDAGFPQAGCKKRCCQRAWLDPQLRRKVSCVGLIDHETGQRWIFDCTPDFPDQLQTLDRMSRDRLGVADASQPVKRIEPLDGIFLTHAHIGHYAGLIHLGREVMGTSDIPVFAMPRMKQFLSNHGPWSQLVKLNNISIRSLKADQSVQLNDRISVTPFLVPHRDEFSETVGFKIAGPSKSVAFLPDIDKWSRWDRSIESLIKDVDLALLDGTFFENGEIPGRDMSQIPHPFVSESIKRFSTLDETDRKKVKFIHFNHTNPVLQPDGNAKRQIEMASMSIAAEGESIDLGAK